ncbi:protein yipf [Anaeramoeba flamelloides]|uniref:Protein yipf n=1 Tax=Anaeramoeba flamelloides TaxID=1746091 RepID=A0ABQ8XAS2_9EUKA|nr:protein yipf [Anaeramoeba flamelloides]
MSQDEEIDKVLGQVKMNALNSGFFNQLLTKPTTQNTNNNQTSQNQNQQQSQNYNTQLNLQSNISQMSNQQSELIFDFNESSQSEHTINQEANLNNNNNQTNQTDFFQSVYSTDNVYSDMPKSPSFNQMSSMGNNFENEPPLLEELEINFDHIKSKMLSVLNPFKPVDTIFINDSDLAGPLIFCLLLGLFLLFV